MTEEICIMHRKLFNSKLLDFINFAALYVLPLLVMTVCWNRKIKLFIRRLFIYCVIVMFTIKNLLMAPRMLITFFCGFSNFLRHPYFPQIFYFLVEKPNDWTFISSIYGSGREHYEKEVESIKSNTPCYVIQIKRRQKIYMASEIQIVQPTCWHRLGVGVCVWCQICEIMFCGRPNEIS